MCVLLCFHVCYTCAYICNPHQISLHFSIPSTIFILCLFIQKLPTQCYMRYIYVYRNNIDYHTIQVNIWCIYNMKYAQHCKILPHLLFFYDYLFILIFFSPFSVLDYLWQVGGVLFMILMVLFFVFYVYTLYKLIFIFHISKSNEKLLNFLYKNKKLGGGSRNNSVVYVNLFYLYFVYWNSKKHKTSVFIIKLKWISIWSKFSVN